APAGPGPRTRVRGAGIRWAGSRPPPFVVFGFSVVSGNLIGLSRVSGKKMQSFCGSLTATTPSVRDFWSRGKELREPTALPGKSAATPKKVYGVHHLESGWKTGPRGRVGSFCKVRQRSWKARAGPSSGKLSKRAVKAAPAA